MSTYRERRLRRAERLDEWAKKREQRGREALDRAASISERFYMGQPILVGHHSERKARRDQQRMWDAQNRGYAHLAKSAEFKTRARNIRRQAERSIYSDDPDAIERLRERIATLEAERDRVKAYNASCRAGTPDDSLLDDAQRADLEGLIRLGFAKPDRSFPAYHLSNLSGNIKRQRDRLARLSRL